MKNEEIAQQADQTLTALIEMVETIPAEKFNMVPFEGSWTAGQLTQHMVLSNSGFADLLNGPVKDTERAPDAAVEGIKSAFLNFEIKMESPDFIRPEKKNYDKDGLLAALSGIKADITTSAATLDLSQTCLSFELPVLGYVTRLEAVSFVICHTQRHIHQLKNIYTKLVMN
ncbi:MAG: DinB family protein [Mucilaginibacter sp.]